MSKRTHTSIAIAPGLYLTAKKKYPNFSRYVEQLIEQDMVNTHREKVTAVIKHELMQDNSFFDELAQRVIEISKAKREGEHD